MHFTLTKLGLSLKRVGYLTYSIYLIQFGTWMNAVINRFTLSQKRLRTKASARKVERKDRTLQIKNY
jgi:hypothetical protein